MAIAGTTAIFRHLEGGAPLVELANLGAFRKDASIVFFSGDTGLGRWSLGGRVAQQLATDRYAVTGVDMLAAFSTRKTSEQTSALLTRAIAVARQRNPGVPIVLIGQSYGSDILTLAIGGLPRDVQATIAKIILIVPGSHAYLQVSPGEILGTARPDVSLAPLARRLPNVSITCIYGVDETDSLCPVFKTANTTVIGLPGGHPLNRDSKALFAVVARAIRTPAATLARL